jgi:hypothetical protein
MAVAAVAAGRRLRRPAAEAVRALLVQAGTHQGRRLEQQAQMVALMAFLQGLLGQRKQIWAAEQARLRTAAGTLCQRAAHLFWVHLVAVPVVGNQPLQLMQVAARAVKTKQPFLMGRPPGRTQASAPSSAVAGT